jgi:hypothetical protein
VVGSVHHHRSRDTGTVTGVNGDALASARADLRLAGYSKLFHLMCYRLGMIDEPVFIVAFWLLCLVQGLGGATHSNIVTITVTVIARPPTCYNTAPPREASFLHKREKWGCGPVTVRHVDFLLRKDAVHSC